jgi:hypothetical protein
VYTVDFAPAASKAMLALPPGATAEIRQRVNEIALVAEFFASPSVDELRSTLHFEVAGQLVSYVVNDARRALTVLSIVPARSE